MNSENKLDVPYNFLRRDLISVIYPWTLRLAWCDDDIHNGAEDDHDGDEHKDYVSVQGLRVQFTTCLFKKKVLEKYNFNKDDNNSPFSGCTVHYPKNQNTLSQY